MNENEVRILFMGTPEIAAATLRALSSHEGARVIGAVTQPDRKKGRGSGTEGSGGKEREMRLRKGCRGGRENGSPRSGALS